MPRHCETFAGRMWEKVVALGGRHQNKIPMPFQIRETTETQVPIVSPLLQPPCRKNANYQTEMFLQMIQNFTYANT